MSDVEDPGRPPRKSKEHPLPGQHSKQVHFETTNGGGGKQSYPPPPQASSAPNSPGTTQAAPPGKSQQKASSKSSPVDNQPTSFPQVGAPPGQFGPGQWYTSADPRMSLNQPQQYYQQQQPQYHLPPNGGGGGGYWQQSGVPVFANGAPAGTHFYPTAVPPHYAAFNNICHPVFLTLVHHLHHHYFLPSRASASLFPPLPDLHHRVPYHHRHHNTSALVAGTAAAAARENKNMAYYQNAGPPSTGVNFQPPVPDTTFGPIPHVYVPRFDAAPVPQVGPPSLQFVYAPADPCPPSFTVFMPKTFYNEGFNYYASVFSRAQPTYSAMPVGQPGYVIAQQPAMLAQPMTPGQQPVYIAGQAPPGVLQGAPQPFMSCGGGIPVIAGNGNPPDVSGLGRTQGEETLRQLQFAHANKLFEPQEFKPADDDPSRFYYVREVDGNWTQRNRFTIDHMGDCRWYVTDEGWFYAVRLPD
ncbi:hypothetical protein ARSEF4850_007091 [Beauveria asiatica]